MELNEVINKRKSVRHYNQTMVELETIYRLLDTARLAPSGKNKQPWRYLIVNTNDKEFIVNKMREYSKISNDSSVEMTSNIIKESSAFILVFGDIDKENSINDILSIGSSITYLLLKATNEDISSLWVGNILKIKAEIEEYYKLDLELVSGIILGYTDDFIKERPRKSLEEIII